MVNQEKNQSVTDWYGCNKYAVMDANIGCWYWCEVEAVEYFTLYDIQHKCIYSKSVKISLAFEIFYFQ